VERAQRVEPWVFTFKEMKPALAGERSSLR